MADKEKNSRFVEDDIDQFVEIVHPGDQTPPDTDAVDHGTSTQNTDD